MPYTPPTVPARIEEREIVDLAARLVQFDTVNPPGNEEPAMHFLAAYLRSAGLAVEVQPLLPGRANLIARLSGAGSDGHLVLSGHMDVVPLGTAPWRHAPFGGVVEGGRLYGRGAADMKGNVAAMAVALAALARAGFRPRADLILAVTAAEEADGSGAVAVVESGVLAGSAYLVVGEFTGLDVYIAHKGYCVMYITAHGRAGHSALPHLGVNAVAYMAQAVTALQANPFSYTPNAVLGQPTVSVTTIQGGDKINLIPDRCTVGVNMRTVLGQTAEGVLAETRRLLDDLAARSGRAVRTEVTIDTFHPPVVTSADDPLALATVEVVREVRGRPPHVGSLSYGTDAFALATGYGLPAVIVGAGHFEQAHQTDEWVAVAELAQAARIYARLAECLL